MIPDPLDKLSMGIKFPPTPDFSVPQGQTIQPEGPSGSRDGILSHIPEILLGLTGAALLAKSFQEPYAGSRTSQGKVRGIQPAQRALLGLMSGVQMGLQRQHEMKITQAKAQAKAAADQEKATAAENAAKAKVEAARPGQERGKFRAVTSALKSGMVTPQAAQAELTGTDYGDLSLQAPPAKPEADKTAERETARLRAVLSGVRSGTMSPEEAMKTLQQTSYAGVTLQKPPPKTGAAKGGLKFRDMLEAVDRGASPEEAAPGDPRMQALLHKKRPKAPDASSRAYKMSSMGMNMLLADDPATQDVGKRLLKQSATIMDSVLTAGKQVSIPRLVAFIRSRKADFQTKGREASEEAIRNLGGDPDTPEVKQALDEVLMP